MSDGDFDDVVDELGGFGKYQKRLLYILLCPLFLIMPFPLLHQMFVLHVPAHTCVHPEEITAESLGINETVWQGGDAEKAKYFPIIMLLLRESFCRWDIRVRLSAATTTSPVKT